VQSIALSLSLSLSLSLTLCFAFVIAIAMIFAMFLTLRRRYRKHEVNVVYTLFWLGLRYRNLIDWCSLPSLSLSLFRLRCLYRYLYRSCLYYIFNFLRPRYRNCMVYSPAFIPSPSLSLLTVQ
jgi:hypothetical protein